MRYFSFGRSQGVTVIVLQMLGVLSSAESWASDAARRVDDRVSTSRDREQAAALSPRPGEQNQIADDMELEPQEGQSNGATSTYVLSAAGSPSTSAQAISIPKGSGSIQGMGESFSAQLSTGTATFSVPFALMKARGGAQPSLGLSYSSGGGTGPVGQGWSVSVPFIARQTDRGLPKYKDQANWHAEQDTFVFNGGQELVPICTVSSSLGCSGVTDNLAIPSGEREVMPAWSANYQYFRPRVEGSFLRFFWSPDHRSWIVQDKSGTTMELGTPRDDASDVGALDRNPTRSNEIYRWHLSRQYDQHVGAGGKPVNVVVYKYASAGGQAYLSDIFDTPPTTNPTTAPLTDYAHHTRLVWEAKPDSTFSFRSGWRIDDAQRLLRVDVASKRYLTGTAGPRRQVRKYHLAYASEFRKSILASVQVEGRCGESEDDASVPQEDGNGALGPTSCDRLPPMTFGYSRTKGFAPNGTESPGQLAGYLPFDGRASTLVGSPNHSLDEDLSDFFDINSDGLPDVLVTAPGIYGNGHAVFFNAQGGARGFGAATNMGVIGVLGADANTIKLSNLNLGVLDFDGDGRINLLHAPQVKKYSAYDPRFLQGTEPSAQGRVGWHWVGRVIETASGQNQKIDFGKDTRDTQVLDVDFDGLVDVVVSTGTEYQTFFSLGRLPQGDGQFGDGELTGPTTASLRNNPKVACVPHSALPVRFGDADTKLGDMNGDGITDIVRVRRGNVIYWPGRGNGTWGTGERDNCAAGTFGTNRHLSMMGAPFYSDVEGSTLRLSDVDGDGLDDLVQINYDSVDIYLNVDGKGWTSRYILDGTPYHAGYHNRVRLADVNGSGTLDIVWGDAKAYKYVDLQGGQKPFLLTEVKNGLGKSTTLEYSTSTELMRIAEAQTAACGVGADPWATRWCSKMPTIAHVVKRVSEHDNITIRGRPPATYVTEYEYRDPVFEGRQREFRGFSRARARRLGDANSPTDVSESVFLLGECLDPNNGSAWDGVDMNHHCAPPGRWRDNLQEALKGLPVETHKYDVRGVHLSSTENVYTIRTLYTGLDGRFVRYAFLSQTDSLLYDTARAQTTRFGIERSGWIDEAASPAVTPQASAPSAYAEGMAHLRSSSDVDRFGNQTQSKNFGCVGGGACPVNDSASYEVTDETITQVTLPQRIVEHTGGWLWRSQTSYVTGSRDAVQRKKATTSYDPLGRPVLVTGVLAGSEELRRAEPSAPSHIAVDGPIQQSRTLYDEFGNAVRSRAPNGRCAQVSYDDAYGLFASTETVAVGENVASGDLPTVTIECATTGALVSSASYDHGLGVVTEATDLNDRMTLAVYDGMGRITRLHKPSATKPSGSATPTYSTEPSVRISYRLPGCSGCPANSLPLETKHSLIFTETQDGENEADTTNYLQSYAYVDGFGRTLVTLSEADPEPAQDGADWVVGSLLEWDQKSAVSKKYLEFFWNGSGDDFNYESFATTAYGRQRYDAFGRQVQTFDLDGTITLQSRYHALSTDLWDAADLSPGPHQQSYASERKDGHGRTIETTERFRKNGAMEERHVKTLYQNTGEPLVLARIRGADVVMRWMRYDTWGRMVLNVDAHTSTNFTTNYQVGDASGIGAWRYVYNGAGDLVGTSDARGCGQNFFYDGSGRVLGEDYAPCEDHHPAYTAPNSGMDAENLEVIYFYDSSAHVPSSVKPSGWTGGSFTKGRAIAVFDRANASFTSFDGRGRETQTQTRVAVPRALSSAGVPAALSLSARYAPRVYSRSIVYDAADREVEKSTGTEELRVGGTPKVPELLSSSVGGATPSSNVTTSYSRRGTVKASGSSYGTLITGIKRTADGVVTEIIYGDAAETKTAYLYDGRRRISSVQTYRGPPNSWPSSGVAGQTQQLVLQDEDFIYDVVGNPVEIHDWRDPQDWPAGAKPVTKKIQYDDLYRATRVDYVYTEGDDTWVSPFEAENAAVENGNANALDDRVALPTPHVAFEKRLLRQTFEYDWLGNNRKTTDDANGFYDRSLGETTAGDASKPYQLTSAAIPSTPGGRGGSLQTHYDAAGSMTRMTVFRDGECLPEGAESDMRFAYEWDEVGRLVRARRWDTGVSANILELPFTPPAADLRYVYDARDQRVLKEAVDVEDEKSYTLYVFDSLELRRTTYASGNGEGIDLTDYKVSELTVVPYLLVNSVRLARLAFEDGAGLPKSQENGGLGNVNASESKLHVFFELGDYLGSTSVVLDKATGELVERSSFQTYGGAESDYRPSRWKNFREDYRFTGKEEDAEVGLQYFGKRYLSSHLGRWISADPLAVHVPFGEADVNYYAYVEGRSLSAVDPNGLLPWLAAGAIGAAIGFVFDVGTQLYNNGGDFGNINWGSAGVSALAGFASGATMGLVGPAIAAAGTGVAGAGLSGASVVAFTGLAAGTTSAVTGALGSLAKKHLPEWSIGNTRVSGPVGDGPAFSSIGLDFVVGGVLGAAAAAGNLALSNQVVSAEWAAADAGARSIGAWGTWMALSARANSSPAMTNAAFRLFSDQRVRYIKEMARGSSARNLRNALNNTSGEAAKGGVEEGAKKIVPGNDEPARKKTPPKTLPPMPKRGGGENDPRYRTDYWMNPPEGWGKE